MSRKAKQSARVEMIDARGNIARPLSDAVPLWEAKGWTVVQPEQDAGTAETTPKGKDHDK